MTREERLNQLNDEIKLENENIKNLFIEAIQPLTSKKINIRFYRDYYNERVSLRIALVNDNNEVFGTDFDITFEIEKEYNWNDNGGEYKETPDSKLMSLNKGTMGSHTKLTNDGFHKACDMLVGKVWENEEILTNIYNNIDWTNFKEYRDIERQMEKERAAAEKAKREEEENKKNAEIEVIINNLKINDIIKASGWRYNDAEIVKITDKYIYLSTYCNTIDNSRIRFTKEEVAKFIYNHKDLYESK